MILSFFYSQFKKQDRLTIPYGQAKEALDGLLEELRENGAGEFPHDSTSYLDIWCNEEHQLLRKYYESGSMEPTLELTPESERALTWAGDLEKREFVGTESRFRRIFDLLDEISKESSADVAARIASLKEQRSAINAEIKKIERSGVVDTLSGTQIKERFYELSDTAYRLLADFREVEQNFKNFVRRIQERRLTENISKGQLLGFVLETDNEIRESDQGKSFYAFYHFLSSPENQELFSKLLARVLALPEISGLSKNDRLLASLKHRLIDAGEKIIKTNTDLSEQLRRFLDEKVLSENRRSARLIDEIKKHAFTCAEDPPVVRNFFEVDTVPTLFTSMERTLWQAPPVFNRENRPQDAPESVSEEDLAMLLDVQGINLADLEDTINALLGERDEISLEEVVKIYPIEQGVAEVLGYMQIASRADRHSINEQNKSLIPLPPSLGTSLGTIEEREVTMAEIIFRKEKR